MQGITLRYLHGKPGIEFDLRDRAGSGTRDVSENWNLFSETIGLIHAGWRGTVAGTVSKGIKQMRADGSVHGIQ